jgi:hypothetical protein
MLKDMSAHRAGIQAVWVALSLLAAAVAACAGPLHDGVTSERAVPSENARGTDVVPGDGQLRLIVGLSQAPDKRLIADLARVSAARIELLDTITAGRLYVLSLTAEGASSECAAALGRLRQDPRVRSADVDKRRKHDGQA